MNNIKSALSYRYVLVFSSHDLLRPAHIAFPSFNIVKQEFATHTARFYTDFIYQNSNYNFNNQGEYSLNVAAALCINSSIAANSFHNLAIWPDRLIVNNLSQCHIPVVCKSLMKDSLIDQSKLTLELGTPSISLSNNEDLSIIFNVSDSFRHEQAVQVHGWFQLALSLIQKPKMKISYYITNGVGKRDKVAPVVVFPNGDHYDDIYSFNKIENIVRKIINVDVA